MKKTMLGNARILFLVLTHFISFCNGVCPLSNGYIMRGTHCYKRFTPDQISTANSVCGDEAALLPVTDEDVTRMVQEYFNINGWHWTSGRYYDGGNHPGWRWDFIVKIYELRVHYGIFRYFTDYQTSLVNPGNGISNYICLKAFNGYNFTTEACTTFLPYICSYRHNAKICPAGFDSSGSRCLSTGQYEHTHDEAKAICENRFGILYEPRTIADLDDLFNFTFEHNWHMYDMRVGVVYMDDAWRFESDGSLVSSDLWSFNYPIMHVDMLCGLYNATTRRLVNVACDDMYFYICLDKPKTHCPAGYTSFDWSSNCIMHGPTMMDFQSSSSFCKRWGGEIASIRHKAVFDYFDLFSTYASPPIQRKNNWIDVNQWTVLGILQYPDGTTPAYSAILPYYTTAPSNLCYVFKSDLSMNAVLCNASYVLPFCMAKQGDCPLGYLKRGSDCFYFTDGMHDTFSQLTAKGACNSFSGSLAWTRNRTILTDELSLQGYDAKNINKPTMYLMGGIRVAGLWLFPDSNVLYAADSAELQDLWNPGKPDATSGECLVMNYTGQLSNALCTSQPFIICQATEELYGMKELDAMRIDLPILTPTCYEEDIYNPQFRTSPAMYDPQKVSLTACQYRCQTIGYKYASAKYGLYCFCSNIISLKAVDWSLCNYPCSDIESDEACGSPDGRYITVIKTGNGSMVPVRNLSLTTNPTLELGVGSNVTILINATLLTRASYRVRFGEGDGFSAEFSMATNYSNSSISHMYNLPGTFIATVMLYDTLDIALPVYETVIIQVTKSAPSPVKLDCPVVVIPGILFYCNITFFYGNPLTLKIDVGNGSVADIFPIQEPSVYAMGVPVAQRPMRYMQDISFNSSVTIVMPWTRVKENSVLLAFSAYVSVPGDITFLVLRPTCGGAPACSASGTCDSICSDVVNDAYSCAVGVFCTQGLSCFDGTASLSTCGSSVGLLPDAYTVVVEMVVTTTLGYNYIVLDQGQYMWPMLQKGDVLAFIPGSAVVASRSTTEEADIGYPTDASSLIGPGDPLGVRHYVSATVSTPVIFNYPVIYSVIGNYTFNIELSDGVTTVTNSSLIAAQIPIILSPPEMPSFIPPNVLLNNATRLMIPLLQGSDILLMVDWGDGNITWRYFTEIHNGIILDDHLCKQPGVFDIVVKIFNKHTIQDNLPLDMWIFHHLQYCQAPCDMTIWTFAHNGPVLWPNPGAITFSITALSGVELPTNATFSFDFGNGIVYGGYNSSQDNWICGGDDLNGTESCTNGFGFSIPNSYEPGDYNIKFSCNNMLSNFTWPTNVTIYAEIMGLAGVMQYIPLFPIGGTELQPGGGVKENWFPVNRDVTLNMTKKQGTVFEYCAELEDGTPLGCFTPDTLHFSFKKAGDYTIIVYGKNPLQPRSVTATFIMRVAELVSEAQIDDYSQTTDAGQNKSFQILWENKGSHSCFVLDYGDGSSVSIWRTDSDEPSEMEDCYDFIKSAGLPLDVNSSYEGFLPTDQDFVDWVHLYEMGFYDMWIYAFNPLSSSNFTVRATVAPVPCSPPLLYLKNNATKFWKAPIFVRSEVIRVESVCKLNCTNSLSTRKYWKGINVDQMYGRAAYVLNLTDWSSKNKSILYIAPLTLLYGTYKFTYTVEIEANLTDERMRGLPPFKRAVSTYITVAKSSLILMMNKGGMGRQTYGWSQNISINPREYSYDPDWPDDKSFELKWYCHRVYPVTETLPRVAIGNESWPSDSPTSVPISLSEPPDRSTLLPDQGGCFGKGPGRILLAEDYLELNTMQFWTYNITYRITVVMSNDTRKVEGFMDIVLLPYIPPIVQVRCQFEDMCRSAPKGLTINPSGRLALLATCDDYCGDSLQYSWSIYKHENGSDISIQVSSEY